MSEKVSLLLLSTTFCLLCDIKSRSHCQNPLENSAHRCARTICVRICASMCGCVCVSVWTYWIGYHFNYGSVLPYLRVDTFSIDQFAVWGCQVHCSYQPRTKLISLEYLNLRRSTLSTHLYSDIHSHPLPLLLSLCVCEYLYTSLQHIINWNNGYSFISACDSC